MRAVVTGAGGFIGHHLVTRLKAEGVWVRGVDLKLPEFEESPVDEFEILDLRQADAAVGAFRGVDHVYALAANMGGMGFISANDAAIMRDNALINLHSLEAARQCGVQRYLFSSSACVYPEYRQTEQDATALKEEDAYPAQPQDGYGWEKLLAERQCAYYANDYGLDVRVARFHNIYGPLGTFRGGREKAPAALSRKVAEVQEGGSIEVWGDGNQRRSFCYIEDCITGVTRLMDSAYREPMNVGSDQLVTINHLTELIIASSKKKGISMRHVEGPEGVRGRNSDNARIRKVLGWMPTTTLAEGLAPTYAWVAGQVSALDDDAGRPGGRT